MRQKPQGKELGMFDFIFRKLGIRDELPLRTHQYSTLVGRDREGDLYVALFGVPPDPIPELFGTYPDRVFNLVGGSLERITALSNGREPTQTRTFKGKFSYDQVILQIYLADKDVVEAGKNATLSPEGGPKFVPPQEALHLYYGGSIWGSGCSMMLRGFLDEIDARQIVTAKEG